MMIDYTWQPIEDLPEDWRDLAALELGALAEIWQEQATSMRQSEALKHFNEKLKRQWAIETGIIEGLYTLDRGTTILLVERGIESSLIPHGATNKPVETVAALLQDQEATLEGLFDFVASRRALSKSYIKELHHTLTAHQDSVEALDQFNHLVQMSLRKGEWKVLPNNPRKTSDGSMHEYCPPVHVDSEMDRLIAMHLKHQELGVTPEVEAAWLHHRFTQIHPFQDGNGRVARALASLILMRAHWFPLVVDRDNRLEYLDALEAADHGNLAPLCRMFAKLMKKSFRKAISLSEDVLSSRASTRQIIDSATNKLHDKQPATRDQKRDAVFAIADALLDYTYDKLSELSAELTAALSAINSGYSAYSDQKTIHKNNAFWQQVLDVANTLDYFADLRRYHVFTRLIIREQRKTELVVSLHPVGREFSGVMVAVAFLLYRSLDDQGNAVGGTSAPIPVCSELFEFTYQENTQAVLARYEPWLTGVITAALEEWRRQL